MKKVLGLMFAVLLAFAMTGCSKEDEFIVGFIYIGHVGDGGWTYSHDQGRQYVEDELGVKTLALPAIPEDSSVQDRMRQLIEEGADVIIANSFGYMDHMVTVSEEYPDVTFLHCSGYKSTENMGNYFGRIYQARYLTGIAAGLKAKEEGNPNMGYVAAFDIPEVIRGINAFTLGAQSVYPEATVEVSWTNTWYHPETERQAAEALINKGVGIIAQHQDTTEPQKAAEAAGIYSVGYHTNMDSFAPEAHLLSAVWNWGPYYKAQIEAVQNGTWESSSYWEGFEAGIVDIAGYGKNVAAGTETAVEDAKAKIINGELVIFSGEIFDNTDTLKVAEGSSLTDVELLGMDWYVKGVISNK